MAFETLPKLDVRSRMVSSIFFEDVSLLFLLALYGLEGRATTRRFLAKVLDVLPGIALESGFQFARASELRRAQGFSNAVVGAVDHPVDLWPARWNKAVVDTEIGAALIEAMSSNGSTLPVGGKAAAVLLGCAGQGRVGPEWLSLMQRIDKALGRACALFAQQLHINSTRFGLIDGREYGAALVLVAHQRHIFDDVDAREAWHIGSELLEGGNFSSRPLQQLRHPVSTQYSAGCEATHLLIDELAKRHQQIVQWHEQRRSFIQHQRFLFVVECLVYSMCRTAPVGRRLLKLALDYVVLRLSEAQRQLINGAVGSSGIARRIAGVVVEFFCKFSIVLDSLPLLQKRPAWSHSSSAAGAYCVQGDHPGPDMTLGAAS